MRRRSSRNFVTVSTLVAIWSRSVVILRADSPAGEKGREHVRWPVSLFLIISTAARVGCNAEGSRLAGDEPDKLLPVERALISGASGLVGSALVPFLESHGYQITRLVRRPARDSREVQWDPMQRTPPNLVSGFDAVIHLSGESVQGRWTASRTRRIRE